MLSLTEIHRKVENYSAKIVCEYFLQVHEEYKKLAQRMSKSNTTVIVQNNLTRSMLIEYGFHPSHIKLNFNKQCCDYPCFRVDFERDTELIIYPNIAEATNMLTWDRCALPKESTWHCDSPTSFGRTNMCNNVVDPEDVAQICQKN